MFKKISMLVPLRTYNMLWRLIKPRGWSFQKLFDFAVSLAKIALEAHAKGNCIVLYDKEGNPIKELTIPPMVN